MAGTEVTYVGDRWHQTENLVVIFGKFAWVFAVIGTMLSLFSGITKTQTYNSLAANPSLQAIASMQIGTIVYDFVSVGVSVVITLAYVIKPFSKHCAAKDWDALLEDKMFGKFPRMWLMGILLEVFGSGIGGMGILFPALLLKLNRPDKGRLLAKEAWSASLIEDL